jgi:hypothetical protein
MSLGATGLKEVRTEELRRLLRHLHRGELSCPLDANALTGVGLFPLIDRLEHLRGLDTPAAMAVIVAVLAERTR